MARIELNNSGVVFDKAAHTYELNGKMLSGITDMLHRQLYPTEFDNVPWSMVEKAGQYGTTVHDSLELFDSEWINDGTVEVQDYISICKEYGLVHEASEYTVSDGKTWASNIDKVYRVSDDTFDIVDLKTYGSITPQKIEKARWQLSVYQYFFSLQNPKAKVGRLLILHIRNKQKKDGTFDHIAEVIPVKCIPSDIVKELLTADEEGRQFMNPYDIPPTYASLEPHIRELLATKAEVDAELAKIKTTMLQDMEIMNVRNWTTAEGMRITRKLPSTRSSLDLQKLKKAYPEIPYDDFMKQSTVSGSILIAV